MFDDYKRQVGSEKMAEDRVVRGVLSLTPKRRMMICNMFPRARGSHCFTVTITNSTSGKSVKPMQLFVHGTTTSMVSFYCSRSS